MLYWFEVIRRNALCGLQFWMGQRLYLFIYLFFGVILLLVFAFASFYYFAPHLLLVSLFSLFCHTFSVQSSTLMIWILLRQECKSQISPRSCRRMLPTSQSRSTQVATSLSTLWTAFLFCHPPCLYPISPCYPGPYLVSAEFAPHWTAVFFWSNYIPTQSLPLPFFPSFQASCNPFSLFHTSFRCLLSVVHCPINLWLSY